MNNLINTFEDMVLDKDVRDNLNKYISEQEIPNLLFISPYPGTGKTTTADLLIELLDDTYDVLRIAGSTENGVDTVRDKIEPFVSAVGFKPKKIVYIGEGDYLTVNSQAALRELMELEDVSFIITANYDKFSKPFLSRCTVYDYSNPNKRDIGKYLYRVFPSILPKDITEVVINNYPDIRSMLIYLDRGIFTETNIGNDQMFKDLCKTTHYGTRFKKIKRFNNVENELFLKYLAEHSEELAGENILEYIDALNTTQYRNNIVTMKYINILDFLIHHVRS